MINLYTWTTPNGRKISIALEEMGLPYEVHAVDLSKGESHTPEYAAINPHEAIPVIVDTDGNQTIVESGAILLYLAEKCGKLLPSDENARWDAIQWLLWQAAAQGPSLGQAHHYLKFNPGKSPYSEERFRARARDIYKQLNARLQGREYVAGGELTIADVAIWPWVSRYEFHQVDLFQYPDVYQWYTKLAARPGFQAGYKVPDPSHEIPVPVRAG